MTESSVSNGLYQLNIETVKVNTFEETSHVLFSFLNRYVSNSIFLSSFRDRNF